jgi:PPOX class probable F420-dependent enzyme
MADDKLLVEAARSPVARLATIGAAGVDLVPITFVLARSTVVTAIDHKAKTTRSLQRLHNIDRDPRVTILIDHYDDDWASLWWVRLRGLARVLDDGPRSVTAIAQLVAIPTALRRRAAGGTGDRSRRHRGTNVACLMRR